MDRLSILFSILYQYQKIVPPTYQMRLLGLPVTDKSYVYLPAVQVGLIHKEKEVLLMLIMLASTFQFIFFILFLLLWISYWIYL